VKRGSNGQRVGLGKNWVEAGLYAGALPEGVSPTFADRQRRRRRPRGLNQEGHYSRWSTAIPKEQQSRTHGRVLTTGWKKGKGKEVASYSDSSPPGGRRGKTPEATQATKSSGGKRTYDFESVAQLSARPLRECFQHRPCRKAALGGRDVTRTPREKCRQNGPFPIE